MRKRRNPIEQMIEFSWQIRRDLEDLGVQFLDDEVVIPITEDEPDAGKDSDKG